MRRHRHDNVDDGRTPSGGVLAMLSSLDEPPLDAFVSGYIYALRGGSGLVEALARLGRSDLVERVKNKLRGARSTRIALAAWHQAVGDE